MIHAISPVVLVLLSTTLAFGSTVEFEGAHEDAPHYPVEFLPAAHRGATETPLFQLAEPDLVWVEDTLASMTLDQKIGQMIMPAYSSSSAATNITTHHVGGFIFTGNTNTHTAIQNNTNSLQALAEHPLIFSIDCETGGGARLASGEGTDFPHNMSMCSANDLALAQQAGRITARECRAMGVQMGFSPVLDVNTDPNNPIIGIRAYSSFPSRVTEMAKAYLTGANAEGLLCTFKHFPGHGPTDVDSHLALPVVKIPCEELQAIHLQPYAILINQGLGDLVMSAHIWYQCLDPGTVEVPATLSSAAMTGILRDQLEFEGIVVSDAFDMNGLSVVSGPAEAAVRGVQSGLDIILVPSSVSLTLSGIRDAVIGGQISEERIDASVRRILAAKTRVGLHTERFTSPLVANQVFSDPTHQQTANQIGALSICSTRVNSSQFPVNTSQNVLLVTSAASSSIFYNESRDYFTNELDSLLPSLTVLNISSNPSTSERNSAVTAAASADRVILAMYDWKPQYSDTISTRNNKIALVNALLGTGKPMAYVSFGSPYQLLLFDEMRNFYCSFSSQRGAQIEMAHVLTGDSAPQGEWPVALQDFANVHAWYLLGE